MAENTLPDEEIIREWPKYTLLMEPKAISRGNLILTSERLVFLKEKVLTEKDIYTLYQMRERGASVREEIEFALGLQRKNFQIPLEDIIGAGLGRYSLLPFRLWLHLRYRSGGKKEKQHTFIFTMSFFKRLILKEFPTFDWRRAINGEVKYLAKQRAKKTGH